MSKAVSRDEVVDYLNTLLDVARIKDDSVNGLQVQGSGTVSKIALATDAALAVYDEAVQQGADMLVVHHGLIWGGLKTITGREYRHLKFLFDHNLNLYAAHLPLDCHEVYGNNVQLAAMLNLENVRPFGFHRGLAIGCSGKIPQGLALAELADVFKAKIGGTPLSLPFGPPKIQRVGIVSGGGSSTLAEAIDLGLDCLITGDGAHYNHHMALESGINVLYLGHYHSETIGVRALGEALTTKFGVPSVFVDVPTLL